MFPDWFPFLAAGLTHEMIVELKHGETYRGFLVGYDKWMNINLRDVTRTSKNGEKTESIKECYIRGHEIVYLRLPSDTYNLVKTEDVQKNRRDTAMNRGYQIQDHGGNSSGGNSSSGHSSGGNPGRRKNNINMPQQQQ